MYGSEAIRSPGKIPCTAHGAIEQSGQAHFSSPNPSLMRGLHTLLRRVRSRSDIFYSHEYPRFAGADPVHIIFCSIGKTLSRFSVTISFLLDKKRKLHALFRIGHSAHASMLPKDFLHNIQPQPAAACAPVP